MIYKDRTESTELKLLMLLNKRMSLSEKDKKYYTNILQGYHGECLFDNWLEKLPSGSLVLNDLLLEQNNNHFQIDSLLIIQQKIYLFDVKNFQGDYYLEEDCWYQSSGMEIKNPLNQLERSEMLLRQLLKPLKVNLQIESNLIFINPHFFLYNAVREHPIIFHPQIPNFFKKLHANFLTPNRMDERIANYLLSQNIKESPFTHIPKYNFAQLRKGISCPKCEGFLDKYIRGKLACNNCGFIEKVENGVLRSVEEYMLLFPHRKITTNDIANWCEILPKRRIREVLTKNNQRIGEGRDAHYIEK